jgi:acetyl-CoA C-acetyltransferase
MSHALIVEALRSPRGRGNDKGALRNLKPVDLLAQQLQALTTRTPLQTAEVNDVYMGCVTQQPIKGPTLPSWH